MALTTAALAALAVLASLLVGCGGSGGNDSSGGSGEVPKSGGTLTVGQPEVISLDPAAAVDGSSINVISQIMEPLYLADGEGKIEPWLATKATTSKDQLTWTFQLRKGVKFSDGQPLTAEDVAFSLETASQGPNWAPLFEAFEKITATSPSTVQIKVSHPLPAMEALLSSYATVVMPKNYGGVSAEEFAEHPVGTGPFALGTWQHGQELTLVANKGYWSPGQPYLDKVVFKAVADDNGRAQQLRGGDLDVAAAPPYQQIASLEGAPGVEVGEYALAFSRYLQFNAESALFKDARMREAVNLGIDREGIIDTSLSGHGELGGSFLSPAVPYHDTGIEAPARDVDKAKQLVAEAEKDGVDPSFTLVFEAGSTLQTLASQVIQQDLEEVGFKVKLQSLEGATLLEKMSEGDYEAGILGLYPNVLDPSENVFFYIATEGLFTKADTTKLSKLAEEGSSVSASSKRQAIYDQIQEEVDKAHYTLTVSYEPWIWGFQDDVVGFEVNPLNIAWFADVGFAK
ncbi:MAG TPA: ABC transporter substrate-binding protein [Solirubrobacterales bacterium]|nr:ABC transporter substrate-binding protein [Solirubrobacterales bacterium]